MSNDHFATSRAPIDTQDLRSMLDRIRGIRDASDLDLLLFFYRHPRALLTSEQFALVNNILLMNFVELADAFRSGLTVGKMRSNPVIHSKEKE